MRRSVTGGLILVAIVLAWSLLAGIGIFSISSGSMEPTLQQNEHCVANKLAFGVSTYNVLPFFPLEHPPKFLLRWSSPQRGDIVAFSLLERFSGLETKERSLYMKRTIGLPGESVTIRSDTVFIDGQRIEEPYIFHTGRLNAHAVNLFPIHKRFTLDNYGPMIVPKKNWVLDLSEQGSLRSWSAVLSDDGAVVDLAQGTINGTIQTSYTFQHDFYFLIGDNRHSSHDSRWIGPIQEDCIVAKLVWP